MSLIFFTKLATGLTCFQIDLSFVLWHHIVTALIQMSLATKCKIIDLTKKETKNLAW